MAKKTKTIQQLQQELEAKTQQLDALQSERDKLAAQLDAVDKQIAALTGKAGKRGRKATRKKSAGRKPATKTRRPRRGKGAKPLVEYVKQVLAKSDDGMRVKDIMEAVKKAGYKSSSKDFYGIVAAAVRDEDNFEKVKRGVYKLKK